MLFSETKMQIDMIHRVPLHHLLEFWCTKQCISYLSNQLQDFGEGTAWLMLSCKNLFVVRWILYVAHGIANVGPAVA